MDENSDDHIDKLFRDSIEPLSESPVKTVWENIEQQLDKNNAEKYKRKYIIYKRAVVVLLFLLLSLATYNLVNYYKPGITGNSDKSLNKKNSPGNINNSSADSIKQALSYQNNSINSILRGIKSNRKQIIKQRLIAKIKNGIAEQGLSTNENAQPAHAVISVGTAPEVITNANNNTALVNSLALQLPGTGINKLVNGKHNKLAERINKKDNKIFPRFSVTVFAAPEFANYTLRNDEVNPYENKQVIQKRERHLFSYSSGFLISYNLNKKFILQSGISYSSSNINIDPDKIYAEKDNSGDIKYRYNISSGYGYILPSFNSSPAIGDSLYTRTSVHTLQFISIPLIIRYRFVHKKLSLDPGLGIAFNFLTRGSLTTEVNDDTSSESEVITQLDGLKKINYSFLLTSELRYQVSKKWSFITEPYFKYALAPINTGTIVKTYPYNIGLGIGVMCNL